MFSQGFSKSLLSLKGDRAAFKLIVHQALCNDLAVGWDKRQLSRAGPPWAELRLVGRRSHSLAGPTLLYTDA